MINLSSYTKFINEATEPNLPEVLDYYVFFNDDYDKFLSWTDETRVTNEVNWSLDDKRIWDAYVHAETKLYILHMLLDEGTNGKREYIGAVTDHNNKVKFAYYNCGNVVSIDYVQKLIDKIAFVDTYIDE